MCQERKRAVGCRRASVAERPAREQRQRLQRDGVRVRQLRVVRVRVRQRGAQRRQQRARRRARRPAAALARGRVDPLLLRENAL